MPRTPLHTIGYEGSSIDEFLATLGAVGIDLLIDVRDVPISRKKGFSKSALASHLAHHRIEYLHLKGLGDPKPGRVAAREGRFHDFRRIFGVHLRTASAQADMVRGIEAAKGRMAIAVELQLVEEMRGLRLGVSRLAVIGRAAGRHG